MLYIKKLNIKEEKLMMGLNTAFKKVYGEVLEPYGFQKMKGRNPYFVRMVGDEIVHVITCIPRQRIMRTDNKKFDILAGVATVYRGRINLDETVRSNMNWMQSIVGFHRSSPLFEGDKDMFDKWYMFSYDEDDESLIASMKYTAELVKYIVLPIIDRAYNLEACYEYFTRYGAIVAINKNEYELEKTHDDKEGLITTKIFDEKKYRIIRENNFEKWKKKAFITVNDKRNNYSMLDYEKQKEMFYEYMLDDIKKFNELVSNPEKLEGLYQKRKRNNLEILKKCGIEVDTKNLERLSNMIHPDRVHIPEELL